MFTARASYEEQPSVFIVAQATKMSRKRNGPARRVNSMPAALKPAALHSNLFGS
jgi:hypothetical protein